MNPHRLSLLALLAGCDGDDPVAPDPMDRYADPTAVQGRAYARCSFETRAADGHLLATGDYDAAGRRVLQEDCFDADGEPIRRLEWVHVLGRPRLYSEALWNFDSGVLEPFSMTAYTWQDGLLVVTRNERWTEAYRYDPSGRRVERVGTPLEGEPSVETWTWESVDVAHIRDAEDERWMAWNEDFHPVRQEGDGETIDWHWFGDELRFVDRYFADGTSYHEEFRYTDGRRTETRVDGDATTTTSWACPHPG